MAVDRCVAGEEGGIAVALAGREDGRRLVVRFARHHYLTGWVFRATC